MDTIYSIFCVLRTSRRAPLRIMVSLRLLSHRFRDVAPAAQAAQATQAAEAAQAAQALQAAQAAQGPKLTKRRRSGVIPAPQYRNYGKLEKVGKS